MSSFQLGFQEIAFVIIEVVEIGSEMSEIMSPASLHFIPPRAKCSARENAKYNYYVSS